MTKVNRKKEIFKKYSILENAAKREFTNFKRKNHELYVEFKHIVTTFKRIF